MFTLMIVLNSGYTHTIVSESKELLGGLVKDFKDSKALAKGGVRLYRNLDFAINLDQVAFMAIFENKKTEG